MGEETSDEHADAHLKRQMGDPMSLIVTFCCWHQARLCGDGCICLFLSAELVA
jgi:hypothetical protein